MSYEADLLLVNGSPLSDVGTLTNIATVMVNGRWADIALQAAQSAAERLTLGQP